MRILMLLVHIHGHLTGAASMPILIPIPTPPGTTIAGVHELEKGAMRAAFINAVVAATSRADELSRAGAH